MKKIGAEILIIALGVIILAFGFGRLLSTLAEYKHIERMAEIEQECKQKEQPND